jgi:hypothetical protein
MTLCFCDLIDSCSTIVYQCFILSKQIGGFKLDSLKHIFDKYFVSIFDKHNLGNVASFWRILSTPVLLIPGFSVGWKSGSG